MPGLRQGFAFTDKPYEVWVQFSREDSPNEGYSLRMKTNDREGAIAVANFWDERVNVRFVELPRDWRSVLDRKFDALEVYIRSL